MALVVALVLVVPVVLVEPVGAVVEGLDLGWMLRGPWMATV